MLFRSPACLPALVFCFVSLFCFSISPLVLVAILPYLYTNISIPALMLPKRATLYLDPFVTDNHTYTLELQQLMAYNQPAAQYLSEIPAPL